jgi:FkbM family methyltransferase
MSVFKKCVMGSIAALPIGLRLRVRRIPVLAQLQRVLFKALTQASAVETYAVTAGPARGLKLAFKLPEEKAYWMGTHELPVVELLQNECGAGYVCWDVGSYIGYVAAVLGRQSQTPVYCFEPLAENIDRIGLQQKLNPGIRLEVVPMALGGHSGHAEFVIGNDMTMGKLAESTFQSDARTVRRLNVPMATIDECVSARGLPAPDLIKVDTEGGEYFVLSGGEKTLSAKKPKLMLEVHGCPEDVKLWELLKRHGYRCRVVETGRLAEALPPAGRHLWCVNGSPK